MPPSKMVLTPAKNAREYLAFLSGWQRLYVDALRQAVMRTAPELEERLKWGHLVYFGQGPVLLIRAEPTRVLFGFWRGKRLKHIEPRLSGTGKYDMGTLELRQGTPLEREVVTQLVAEAVRLDSTLGDPTAIAKGQPVVLLSGGNPQIPKADGAAPVQAYIAAMPGWKRDIGRRLDELVEREVPGVQKAVRWNSPMYGVEGQGWFASFHVFTKYVKLTFFQGESLHPVPPGGTGKDARWIDIHEDDLDEAQLASWVRQAAALPGWGLNPAKSPPAAAPRGPTSGPARASSPRG